MPQDGFLGSGHNVVTSVLFSPGGHGRGGEMVAVAEMSRQSQQLSPPCMKCSVIGETCSDPVASSVLAATLLGSEC